VAVSRRREILDAYWEERKYTCDDACYDSCYKTCEYLHPQDDDFYDNCVQVCLEDCCSE
jgi:hypothetical protein